MFISQRAWIFIAGMMSGSLFLLAAGATVPSLFLIYTPFLPLLAVGLMLGAPSAILASGVASGFSLLMGPGTLILFIMLFAIPATYYIRKSLSQISLLQNQRIWYPQGLILTDLTCYAAILIVALVATLSNTLSASELNNLLPPATEGEPEILTAARLWIAEKSFLVFGGTVWVQLSIFYGLAALANFIIAGYNRALRPSLALLPFMPNGWLLAALLGAGMLSFSDDTAYALAAKSAFITLLYPYFLMGIALMHRHSLIWPSRRLWLSLVYFFMLAFPAIILGFTGLGLAAQARHLSNRSSGQISQP